MTKTQKRTEKLTQAIEYLLHAANGRNRERLLSLTNVAWILNKATQIDYAHMTGGSVAKSYKYPASTTMILAVTNGPDYVAVRISRQNATSSPVTWAGPQSIRDTDVRHWMARQTLYTLTEGHWLILSRYECKLFSKGRF